MSNFVEKNFYNLINIFKNSTIKELYEHMLFHFNLLPSQLQTSIETFLTQYQYWGKLNLESKNYNYLLEKAKTFKTHYKDYIWLFNKLKDVKSKFVLFSILNNFYNFDFFNLKNAKETVYTHYFDLDILPDMKNEIFVDVGSYIGDTVIDFIKCYGENCYRKIYCYEITDTNLSYLKQNLISFKKILIKNKAVTDKKGFVYIKSNINSSSANQTSSTGDILIEATSLDKDIKEKITLVKMDIEGDEQKAVKGMKEHIIKDSPKLLISVYHNNVDIFKIAKMIYAYNKNYDFYLRYYGGPIYATEFVLIAIPS